MVKPREIKALNTSLVSNNENLIKEKKRTILFFAHIGHKSFLTGSENYLLNLIKVLSNDFNCILVSPTMSLLISEVKQLNIPVRIINYPMVWEIWKPTKNIEKETNKMNIHTSTDHLMDLIEKLQPSFVFVNTSVNLVPAIAAKKAKVLVIWLINEVIENNPYTLKAVQTIDYFSDWIVGISNTVLQPFFEYNLNKKTFLLYPITTIKSDFKSNLLHLRKKLKIKESSIIVGYLSSYISPEKGLKHFIKMAVALCKKHKNVYFFIQGKPTNLPYFNQCLNLIKSSRFRNKFNLLPFDINVYYFFHSVDIIVIPSLIDEGFPLVGLESFLYGKPVVAYRSGGLIEQLEQLNNEDLLVKKGDTDELKQNVSKLLKNSAIRQQVGLTNKQKAAELFGPNSFRVRLNRLLKKIDNP
ncbi:glycosyltransferase [Bacillus solitudinis]|uniref:glycosyltransferase n=1 Tax=Bacillus solitudinis TaxID=2014074 RepID=UPI000C23820B|nr:glycosyltransferase [Bacillus solitudinis]